MISATLNRQVEAERRTGEAMRQRLGRRADAPALLAASDRRLEDLLAKQAHLARVKPRR